MNPLETDPGSAPGRAAVPGFAGRRARAEQFPGGGKSAPPNTIFPGALIRRFALVSPSPLATLLAPWNLSLGTWNFPRRG